MKCNSKENTIDYLIDKKVIDNNNIIRNNNKYLIYDEKLVQYAKNHYGIVGVNPFTVKRGTITPNNDFFSAIDEFNENVEIQIKDDPFLYSSEENKPKEFTIEEDNLSDEEKQRLFEKEADDKKYAAEKYAEEEDKARHIGQDPLMVKLDKEVLKIQNLLQRALKKEKGDAFKGQAGAALHAINKEVMLGTGLKRWRSMSKLEAHNYIRSIVAFYSFLENQTITLNDALENIKEGHPLTTYKKKFAYIHGETFLKSFGETKDIEKILKELYKATDILTEKEYNELVTKAAIVKERMSQFRIDLSKLRTDILVEQFGNTRYFKQVEIQYKTNAERRYRKRTDLSKAERQEAVNKFMIDNRDLIEKETAEAFRTLLEETSYDISNITSNIISDANTNNPFIQLAYRVIAQSEINYKNNVQRRLIKLNALQNGSKVLITEDSEMVRPDSWYYAKGFTKQEYIDALNNGLRLGRENFINMTEKDGRGVVYLKGEIKAEYRSKIRQLRKNIKSAVSDERKAAAQAEYNKFIKENTEQGNLKNTVRPIAKWRNDLSELTVGERIMLEEFKAYTRANHGKFSKRMSLIQGSAGFGKKHDPIRFFMVPKQLETNFGKFMRGDVVGGIKKTTRSILQKEIDDVEEALTMERVKDEKGEMKFVSKSHQDLAGKDENSLNINYRNEVFDEQNMDLLSVYAKEIENAEKFQANKEIEEVALMIANAARDKKFFKTVGLTKKIKMAIGANEAWGQFNEIDGENSQVYDKLMNMIENNVYEITTKYAGSIAGIDTNRVVGSFIAYSSYLGMALKIPGAVNNFFIGNIANFIEQAGGEFTTLKDAKKGYAVYSSNFGGIIGDIGRPVKTNFVNQLMSVFDTGGDYSQLNNQFERDNRVKQLSESSSLFGLYSSGEHFMQGTLFLSILSGTKVLNSEGKYVNKEGKEVGSKKEAASLLDMYEINKEGVLALRKNKLGNDLFTYTTVDLLNKYSNGGELSIKTLVKDRIFRAHGIYDTKRQSSWQRHWYGKLFLHYKKFFESALLNRFRGVGNVLRPVNSLKDHEKYYNFSTGQEEYGYHSTFLREAIGTARRLVVQITNTAEEAKSQKRPLSNHEVANIRKSLTEIGITFSMIQLAWIFAMAAAAEDDDELLWAISYFARRQTNELQQFYHPGEMIRMAKNPIASIPQLTAITNTTSALVNPFTWNEVYTTGENAGKSKNVTKVKRVFLPKSSFLGYDVNYKKMYNFFDSLNN